jgi:hypothetical protein
MCPADSRPGSRPHLGPSRSSPAIHGPDSRCERAVSARPPWSLPEEREARSNAAAVTPGDLPRSLVRQPEHRSWNRPPTSATDADGASRGIDAVPLRNHYLGSPGPLGEEARRAQRPFLPRIVASRCSRPNGRGDSRWRSPRMTREPEASNADRGERRGHEVQRLGGAAAPRPAGRPD